MAHVDHFAIIRKSYRDPAVRTVLLWEDGKLRVVTNDEREFTFYRKVCSAKSLSWTKRVLPALFPLDELLSPYQMRVCYEMKPLSPRARADLSAALDELGQAGHDETIFDERRREEDAP
jgi:hypothetical protein